MPAVNQSGLLRRTRSLFRRHLDDERGVTTIEFSISAVLFMFILFWMLETGFIMMRWIMLEQSVDHAARNLRINGLPDSIKVNGVVNQNAAHEYIKDLVCDNTAIIKDCDTALRLELVSAGASAGLDNSNIQCIDRTGDVDPATIPPNITGGSRAAADIDSIQYMRVCVVIDPILPASYAMPLPRDASGGVAIIVDSAFVNEPS